VNRKDGVLERGLVGLAAPRQLLAKQRPACFPQGIQAASAVGGDEKAEREPARKSDRSELSDRTLRSASRNLDQADLGHVAGKG